jgi:hypothetical protein
VRTLRVTAVGVDFRVDDARAHGVDAHALGGQFAAQADGEGVDGALGRGVVHVQTG